MAAHEVTRHAASATAGVGCVCYIFEFVLICLPAFKKRAQIVIAGGVSQDGRQGWSVTSMRVQRDVTCRYAGGEEGAEHVRGYGRGVGGVGVQQEEER